MPLNLRSIVRKARRFCEILEIPSGVMLKRKEAAFNLDAMQVCFRLKSSGVSPATIFDVGANIGQFALGAVTAFPDATVYAYEPVPSAFKRLEELSRRYKAVVPIRLAMGSSVGVNTIRVTNHTQSSSFLPLHKNHVEAYPHVREDFELEVDVTTLAIETKNRSPAKPVLLKIDVQGFESEVLQGAGDLLSSFEWIILETCTSPMYEGEKGFGEISQYLETRGFRFVSPVEIHRIESGAAAQFDVLFRRCS